MERLIRRKLGWNMQGDETWQVELPQDGAERARAIRILDAALLAVNDRVEHAMIIGDWPEPESPPTGRTFLLELHRREHQRDGAKEGLPVRFLSAREW